MQNPDLIKLAPTLSAEERYKLILADFQRELAGEKSIITESERQALLRFEDRKMYEEYTYHVVLYQWVTALWTREIETEKLRVYASYLVLSHCLEKVLIDAEEKIPKKKREERFERLREYATMLETNAEGFYAYREAISKMEQELYGTPLFDKKADDKLANDYKLIDELIEHHNDIVAEICKSKVFQRHIGPIVKDQKNYLVKKTVPKKEDVEEMVNAMKRLAESEMRKHG